LVNNAGIGLRGFFEDLSETEIRRLFEVNVFGVMAVTRAVLPHMRVAHGGRIVIISSAGGRIGAMTLSGYCAGKFAKALARLWH
jgi:short-subunit dehydrogenase